MTHQFTQAELEAYLDEALAPAEMAEVEAQLRDQKELTSRLEAIHSRRDAGVHSLGEIWRRHRVSCPDRETLGSYLLQILEPGQQKYLEFHLTQLGCRYCLANLADLESRHAKIEDTTQRRERYFRSSAGLLRRE
jgi:hypothetical protein